MNEEICLKDVPEGKADIFLYDEQGNVVKALPADVGGKTSFNPFAIREVRFAMSFLIRRRYLVDEILGGDGEPVTMKFPIRSDDPNGRLLSGRCLADQVEKAGLKVEWAEMNRAAASKIYSDGNPADYQWNLYTEAWGAGAARAWWDNIVSQMYAPWSGSMPGGMTENFWNYENAEIDELSQKAQNGQYLTEKEYWDMARKATELGIQDSVRFYVASQQSYYMTNKARFNVRMAYGLGDGLNEWSIKTADVKPEKDGNAIVVGKIPVPADAIMYDSAAKAWKKVGPGVASFSKGTYTYKWGRWHNGRPITGADIMYTPAFIYEWMSQDGDADKAYDAFYESSIRPTQEISKGFLLNPDGTITTYFDFNHASKDRIGSQGGIWVRAYGSSYNVCVSWDISEALGKLVTEGGKSGTNRSFSSDPAFAEVGVINPKCLADLKAKLEEMKAAKYVPASIAQWKTPAEAGEELAHYRRQVQMIFQDPYASMNPRFKIRDVLEEPLLIHGLGANRSEREELIRQALAEVRLTPVEDFMGRFPHMLSGGQRPRAATARTLILSPALLVADEPVSGRVTTIKEQPIRGEIPSACRRWKEIEEQPMIDPSLVRQHFPALQRTDANGRPLAFFDNPAGTQICGEALDRMRGYLVAMNANHGGAFRASRESDAMVREARSAMADFLGASRPEQIVFGQNMTSLTMHVSRSLARELSAGDEVVVTRLDHDANVAPWLLAARDRGCTVKWVDFDPAQCLWSAEELARQVTARTKIVAVGYASNATGSINPVAEAVRIAHSVGALCVVDAVHFAPHGPIDVASLGCDILVCSAYKFFGPHTGVLCGRYDLLDRLCAYKVRPAGDSPPDKFETGTQSFESIAGVLGAVEYLEWLGRTFGATPAPAQGRRAVLTAAMEAIREHEASLALALHEGLTSIPGLRLYGIGDPRQFSRRVPTFAFTLDGRHPRAICEELDRAGITAWDGNFYARETTIRLGLEESGGMVRVGAVHYTTREEIDRLYAAVRAIAVGDRAG